MTLDIKHLDFDFVKNYLVILSDESDISLKFDNVPQSANGFKDMRLLCSFQQLHNMHPYGSGCSWKIRFDGVQIWLFLFKPSLVAVSDYTCF